MTAEEQVEAVRKKLMELNPGFDGRLLDHGEKNSPTIENGVVTRLMFATGHVTDISPVRALTGLKVLDCVGGYPNQGKLVDLSPLKGLKLVGLTVLETNVSDLTPLQGMPLRDLNYKATKVTDTSPVRGLPLQHIHFDFEPNRDTELLRSIKTLESINGKPVAEFWKEVEGKN